VLKAWYVFTGQIKKNLDKNVKYFLRYLYNKRVCPTKNEPQQGISYLERAREGGEREGEGVRERERWVGRSAGLYLSLG
jgi:hypothetical protein